jgi:hypothetical protein
MSPTSSRTAMKSNSIRVKARSRRSHPRCRADDRRTVLSEFIPHDSSLPLGRLNHDPAACLNSERIEPSEAAS